MRSQTPKPALIHDSLTTAVVVLDQQLQVLSVNAAAEMLFGVSAGHVIGEVVTAVVPHLHAEHDRFRAAIDDGTSYVQHEAELRKPHGNDVITVDCTCTPIFGSRGARLLLLEFVNVDRHVRISREDKLHAQHELSREVVRGLAHEIKNPLGGIRGAAQLLERSATEDSQREMTAIIIREADRLQRLVDRLLGPNRLPQLEEVNVHEALEHVFSLVEVDLPPQITLVRDYDPSLPPLYADREQLIQAFLNIAGNAVQAVQRGFDAGEKDRGIVTMRTRIARQVTVSARKHRLVVVVEIEDDGPGITPELIDRVFYPMVTSRADGSGLGLSIAQYLVHCHGGHIDCESQPGTGHEQARTIFRVVLPLGGPSGRARGRKEPADSGQNRAEETQ